MACFKKEDYNLFFWDNVSGNLMVVRDATPCTSLKRAYQISSFIPLSESSIPILLMCYPQIDLERLLIPYHHWLEFTPELNERGTYDLQYTVPSQDDCIVY